MKFEFECATCGKTDFRSKQAFGMHQNWHVRKGETATTFATPTEPRPSGLALRQATTLDVERPTENSIEELRTALQGYKTENTRLAYEKMKFEKQANLLAELVTQLVDRVAVAEAHRI